MKRAARAARFRLTLGRCMRDFLVLELVFEDANW
jgi:hypothetical protein